MAESLSLAFVHLLEQLSPPERVAFLMREVFDSSYAEIADVLAATEPNTRQLVARARKRLREGHPRFQVDPERHQLVLGRFLAACTSGGVGELLALLREDVTAYSDGGGKANAAINAIHGVDRVIKLLLGIAKKVPPELSIARIDRVNGLPGVVFTWKGRTHLILTLDLDEGDRIRSIYFVTNPDKLPGNIQSPISVDT